MLDFRCEAITTAGNTVERSHVLVPGTDETKKKHSIKIGWDRVGQVRFGFRVGLRWCQGRVEYLTETRIS